MSEGLKRIIEIISLRSKEVDVVAVLVPSFTARRLVDELYPLQELQGVTGIPLIDEARRTREDSQLAERDRYTALIDVGGHVGYVFGKPMIVSDDVVLCAVSDSELRDVAPRLGVDVDEVLGKVDRDGEKYRSEGLLGD